MTTGTTRAHLLELLGARMDRGDDLYGNHDIRLLFTELEHLRTELADERAKVAALSSRRPCPTCEGRLRETTGLVCLACGWDYGRWGEKPRA